MNPNQIRLTDELERQLMAQAIQDQFRARPFRALNGAARKVARMAQEILTRMAEARVKGPETQSI